MKNNNQSQSQNKIKQKLLSRRRSAFFSPETIKRHDSLCVEKSGNSEEDVYSRLRNHRSEIIACMDEHHIQSFVVCFLQEPDDNLNTLYSNLGLATVNFFVNPDEDASEADIIAVRDYLFYLLNEYDNTFEYDMTCITYQQLIRTFAAKSKELGLTSLESQDTYTRILDKAIPGTDVLDLYSTQRYKKK